MFQYNVPHVAWPCCYTILVTLLPCCHASRHGKFMFHCYVALLPFTNNLVQNKQNMRMFHMYVSGKMTWWDRWCTCLWDEMQLVEAKHLGCYIKPPNFRNAVKVLLLHIYIVALSLGVGCTLAALVIQSLSRYWYPESYVAQARVVLSPA